MRENEDTLYLWRCSTCGHEKIREAVYYLGKMVKPAYTVDGWGCDKCEPRGKGRYELVVVASNNQNKTKEELK